MEYIQRKIEQPLKQCLELGKSVLLLGARQTGKTTLLNHLHACDLRYTLLDPELRLRLEKSPNLLRQEIAAYKQLNHNNYPIVTIDEVQKVPALMDAIQLLIDDHLAQFILTGSSVRKLRRHAQFNLLPGRVINFHLDPLALSELPKHFSDLNALLLYGSLPGIFLEPLALMKETELQAYTTNYLEEEVRGEALARDLGGFSRFLELAAIESGNQINLSNLSQELGISRHTLTEYFSVLEDCLIAERIMPITAHTTRKRLSKAPKYLFFDMGIRRIAALEGTQLSAKTMANLFEQFVGLEILRELRIQQSGAKLRYWRDHAGPEVDYLIEYNKLYTPIEVKWTETPTLHDARHLIKFMSEYNCKKPAYIICRTPKPLLLHEDIIALPWQELDRVI